MEQKTVEQLQAEIDQMVSDFNICRSKLSIAEGELKDKHDELQKAMDAHEATKKELADTKAELDSTVIANQELQESFSSLTQETTPEKKTTTITTTVSNSTFKVGEKEYSFSMAKMHYKGEVITANEVLASEQLAAELVTMGSGMIKEIEPAEAQQ